MSPRVNRWGDPIEDDDDAPHGRRLCQLCRCLLDSHHAAPWCAECSLLVSQRLGINPEEWRDLDGEYIVSERGRVAKLLTVDRSHRYLRVSIHGEKRYIHQLVAEVFHGPRPEGALVLHWDDEPTNPTADNLRYGDHAENAQDAKRNAERRAVVANRLREINDLAGDRPAGEESP